MALLDGGLQSIFGAAFGTIYLDGSLIRVTTTDDGTGSLTESATASAIKGQLDAVTEKMRQSAGYTDGDMRIIVLQSGVSIEPDTDDRIVLGGKAWSIADIEADPAQTHWVMRGSLTSVDVPTLAFETPSADNTPLISGTAIGGATVSVEYDAGLPPSTIVVPNDGKWSLSLPNLGDDEYTLKARQTVSGVSSGWSAEHSLVIDTSTS